MDFWKKWFERAVIIALVSVGFITKFYILAILGVIWMIEAI